MRYWQGLESFVRQLVLSGNGTSNYISPCVLLHAGPPEPLTDDGQGGLQPRVTGQAGGVPPLKDLGAEMIWDKLEAIWTVTRGREILRDEFELSLNVPNQSSNHKGSHLLKLAIESIRFGSLLAVSIYSAFS